MPALAFQKGKPAPPPPPSSSFQMQSPVFGQQPDRERGRRMHKAGSWLRKYNNMPAEDQQRALESDEKFQQLPPERQEQLRERLRRFNALPPEDRERMLDRMGHWEEMSPEQRQRWRQFQNQLSAMPSEKRYALRQEFRNLRKMSPEERQRVFESERFKQDYTDTDQSLLRSMLDVADADARREAAAPQDKF
jgi:hypothetical protein